MKRSLYDRFKLLISPTGFALLACVIGRFNQMKMKTIKGFLSDKGLDPNHVDGKIEMQDMINYIKEYATIVREEQIKYSALGAAHHTSINVRGVPERLDDDLESHFNVCRVNVE